MASCIKLHLVEVQS